MEYIKKAKYQVRHHRAPRSHRRLARELSAWCWVNLTCYCMTLCATSLVKVNFASIAMNVSTVYQERL